MTKAMRPDKPGCWFFENTDSRVFPVIVVEKPCNLGSGIALNVVFRMRYFYLEAFENLAGFERWIGQAHPPKKVDRYTMETVYGSGGPTTESAMEKRQNGKMVNYDDVKEYLIGDDDEE